MPGSATEHDITEAEALEVHRSAIIVDGHCDTPYRLKRNGLTMAEHDPSAQFDLEKLRAGGITAPFFVAYVPPFYANRGAARFAFELIDLIHRQVELYPDVLTFATSTAEIRQAKASGKVAALIGVEGGHAIEDSLDTLQALFDRGARYMTLTHVNTNNWADSSGDVARHGGLTEFGREVVRTMNRLGMIVDISHVSDQTFYHALETSSAPLVATHSSCRALTNHPRNMTDQMLRDLAAADGICMINFFSAFINDGVAQTLRKAPRRAGADPQPTDELPNDKIDWDDYVAWFNTIGCPCATIDDAIAHILHAIDVAGIDHVGIGSDFDGVPSLPEGLTDASMMPRLTHELMRRGLGAEDVRKVLGENFLRVYGKIEAAASL